MTLPLTFKGRLPGVVVETALPPRAEAPLLLDVAAFVGFAERGPLHTPVQLEDVAQYQAVFGGDLPVAREAGRPVFAHLPRAVRAFFDNGGRRCYVVRVAGASACANRFRVPGLVRWTASEGWQPVVVEAAWKGGWSDAVSVGTQLRMQPVRIVPGPTSFRAAGSVEIDLQAPTRTTVQPGDVLRVSFEDAPRSLLLMPVAAVEETGVVPGAARLAAITASAPSEQSQVFARSRPIPVAPPLTAQRLDETGWTLLPTPTAPLVAAPPEQGGGYRIVLRADLPLRGGDLLRLRYAEGALWLPVIWAAQLPDDPPGSPRYEVRAAETLWESTLSAVGGAAAQAEVLTFDLHIREGGGTPEVWSHLRFGGDSAEFWPNCLATLRDESPPTTPDVLAGRSQRLSAPLPDGDVLYLPLGMGEFPVFAGPLPLAAPGGKDGLSVFDPSALFLDERLASVGWRNLMNEAEYLLYLNSDLVSASGDRRVGTLRGIHGLLPVEEIGLIAVPDLAHRPWAMPVAPETPPEPEPEPEPAPEPDWSHFQDCVVEAPPETPPSPWPLHAPCPQPYDFTPPVESDMHRVYRQLAHLPVLQPPAEYDPAPLREVHRALVNLCAARADLLAVLSLPQHFEQQQVLDWQRDFTATPEFRDGAPLSYAAVYHGWPQVREDVTPDLRPLRAVPPDGAVCGLIAARELGRGPWIAPANMALQGVVGLVPPLSEADREALFNHQINVLGQQPGRFVPLSAHTLSADRLLLQVSVRRLLIFLRKLAWRRGQQYVFETNNARFRQLVQAGFERVLNELMARGALVAYEVVTGSEINTPADEYNGRLLIALKVAPTQPIEFITVALLRSGEGLLEILER